ncbi:MAG: DASS family sodium-coupled anion symporter [Deltaproteobacteria bacterium]|nr:DASS family sodium-coupled anion symporter [Deltaproteobacteria bacterium]
MPAAEAFALFGNNAVFFILGAFIISAVLVECGLSTRLTVLVLERGAFSPRSLRTSILLFGAFASFWMSEHAVAAMMYPIVLALVGALGLKPGSRFGMSFFFAMAWGCVIGGIATYLGGARNPLAMGILYADTGVRIPFLSWMIASLPLVALLLASALILLRVMFAEEPVDLDAARRSLREEHQNLGAVKGQEIGVAVITVLTIIAWIALHDFIGLAIIALVAVALLFIFRLTQWEEVQRNVNWGIILMYGGAIALGSALSTTGAAAWFVDVTLERMPLSSFALVCLLGALSLLLTEFISNAAVVSVIMPVAIGLARSHGIPFEIMTFAVALPSGLSYVLPMGTPATAIAYGSKFMTQKDFMRVGPLMALISLTLFALVAKLWWPMIGYRF